jgi:hypothetical protein
MENRMKYPDNLSELLDQTKSIKDVIYAKLSAQNCPKLSNIYIRKQISSNGDLKYRTHRNTQLFNSLEYIPNVKLKNSKNINELKGLYVFAKEVNAKVIPVYIGISRTIFRRLRQHGWGKYHNECSLAYLMAREENNALTRSKINIATLEPKKEQIRNFKVAIYPVKNDYDLYFHEVALAALFKTKWNNFRTH